MAAATDYDVVICGSGSAGLCAAIWLSRFNINYTILERRSGPLEVGQADGVQTRTVEILDSFGLAHELLEQAYHVLEIAFWSSSPTSPSSIHRTRYAADKETAVSHQPHVILNQAKINSLMVSQLGASPPIQYSTTVTSLSVPSSPTEPITVTATLPDGSPKTWTTKYLLACDGAHSTIRKSLAIPMVGDTSDSVWGVMDIYPRTTFPDIRKKCVVNSAAGNILIIPREGDAMVRFYIELPAGTTVPSVSLESLQAHAQKVFAPYEITFAETAWWSAYAIGQRVAERFHESWRVFLTGDACHTHSPKAGQGMNVSLQDGYNIGWKLGMVLNGLAGEELVRTYVEEREKTARELIEFDRAFARLFNSKVRKEEGVTAEMVAEGFVKAGRYTAGQAVRYEGGLLTQGGGEELARGVEVGMRFPSAKVVRFADAKGMELVKGMPGDGQWFLVVFAGDLAREDVRGRLEKTCQALNSIVKKFTPDGMDPDSVIDRILVLPGDRKSVEQEQIPEFFTPVTGKWRMKSLMKTFADDEGYNSPHGHAYELYGVGPEKGAVVVVRPDQYVAKITSLEDVESLSGYFGKFLIPARQ
ncbi:hypothetical protein OQA88_5869 [Cercophora sp. LCS_1]